jgi:hypothetical protein
MFSFVGLVGFVGLVDFVGFVGVFLVFRDMVKIFLGRVGKSYQALVKKFSPRIQLGPIPIFNPPT